ncbi:MAG: hypothetical protein AAFY90_04005 [Pseudomonadota bacterium]
MNAENWVTLILALVGIVGAITTYAARSYFQSQLGLLADRRAIYSSFIESLQHFRALLNDDERSNSIDPVVVGYKQALGKMLISSPTDIATAAMAFDDALMAAWNSVNAQETADQLKDLAADASEETSGPEFDGVRKGTVELARQREREKKDHESKLDLAYAELIEKMRLDTFPKSKISIKKEFSEATGTKDQ